MTEPMAWRFEVMTAGEWQKLDRRIGSRDEVTKAAEWLLEQVPSLDGVKVVGSALDPEGRQWRETGPEMTLRRGGEWR